MLLLTLALSISPHSVDMATPGLLRALRAHVSKAGPAAGDERYTLKLVDLNADGRKEAVVLLSGKNWCGTGGCPLYVLTPKPNGWHFIAKTTITRTPIRLLSCRHHGWNNLVVYVVGGGSAGRNVLLRFDGIRYPPNPSVGPTARLRSSSGKVLIGTSNSGYPLFR